MTLRLITENTKPAAIALRIRALGRNQIVRDLMTPESKPESYVFPGAKKGAALSSMAMLECLRDLHPDGLHYARIPLVLS